MAGSTPWAVSIAVLVVVATGLGPSILPACNGFATKTPILGSPRTPRRPASAGLVSPGPLTKSGHVASATSVASATVKSISTAMMASNTDQAIDEVRNPSSLSPVFDFSRDEETKKSAIESFERIDDAIMGGISLSSMRDGGVDRPYASWSGVCRTDGGGFCGTRTLPFVDPLPVPADSDGVYVECRLASDDEPDRRAWKVTVRTDETRGERVFQAQFELPEAKESDDGWVRVKVPFEDFRFVSGPRMVVGGPALNVTGGIYQIGLTMSKFKIGLNMTQVENFRAGYFELQLRQIGFYSDRKMDEQERVTAPTTLSEQEAKKRRPLLVKALLPVARLFFSEKSNRRRSAMKILREKRGMTRMQAVLFGIRSKAGSYGLPRAVASSCRILVVDSVRTIAKLALRLFLLYPLSAIRKVMAFFLKRVKQA
uniref:NADH:ubiquinone oxidoreductase intermediate-associated protein 30 domain-containing protein n=1 Tax=Trieres chinensis TaxID=1514140 RepID=A0A7S1ZIF1_TRICV|eukprot:CAMPEP_0183294088 /NCGR_PEP_ID=MMETSP0160_2-20130417/2545_1 /TAXON_ID=2839 ORGANISM="Odontella Sinensis, Strain Grunow 1884" /NCGR_SAMPLE_ID=MMETSP0160_2 /ASSEMBLY_ACC=CAM_ASM_000250 /LENGTH=426 /DNA_ID=CAMNT_0025455329 /DNA_START=66 /DNA_END=1346 /DNA_ORIENTATION=+